VFIINAIINAYLLSYPYKSYTIPASSMEPSLRVGDRFIAEKKQYVPESLKRGDIVIFPYPDDPAREFVKRIIGLPHDKVEIVNKRVLINDQPIQEPYIQHISEEIFPQESSPRDNFGPVVVPSDSIFLLGDNRDSSLDSRFWENRYVKIHDIAGKPLYLYWAKEMARIGQTLQ
jgi:signal peptidase I